MRRRILIFAMTLVAISPPAWAATPAEQATANAVFEEGRRLSKAGDWAHALPKYLEVSRIENTPGVQLNIADCLEHLGKLASAWGAYREAELRARAASDAERVGVQRLRTNIRLALSVAASRRCGTASMSKRCGLCSRRW